MTANYQDLLAELGSSAFTQLRPAQDQVLSAYADNFQEVKDLAIELPTGAGKSLIALLIAEDWRRQGRKAAILTANKTLAHQMEHEARALGLPVVRMEGSGSQIPGRDKRSYQRAQAIAIMNYWVYFNQNPSVDPTDILILDDAHLAEHCLHSLYSAEIERTRHRSLFESLVTELSQQFPEYSVLQDALEVNAPPMAAAQLLSFLDQASVSQRLREIIDSSPYMETDNDLRFRWWRMRDKLDGANVYLARESIWIRPYIYPLTANPHYAAASQVIYMSATIGDASDIARRLGTRPISRISVDESLASTTYGRRLIIMNSTDDADLSGRIVSVLKTAVSVQPKSLWLCSGRSEAERLRERFAEWLNENGFIGHPTWMLTNMGDEIQEFKSSPNGHLFVAGRFDGMDFKADECRLVIITTLPRSINSQEEFISAYLRDAEFINRRLNQRIVQALGRCNRADDDFGVYILADRRFSAHFGREAQRVGIPSNIMAEIDMAEDLADAPISEVQERVVKFLSSEFEAYDQDLAELSENLGERVVVQSGPPDTSDDEVQGWVALFETENYLLAQQRLRNVADVLTPDRWRQLGAFHQYSESMAAFLRGEQGDAAARGAALNLLEVAIQRGGVSSWFNRLRASLNRRQTAAPQATPVASTDYADEVIRRFDDVLERVGTRGDGFEKRIGRLRQFLATENHNQFQDGLEQLGTLLGYTASRPKYGAATDCRWRGVFGNTREVLTFEAKIEHGASRAISPHDVGQAHNQFARANKEYGDRGYTVRSVIATHLSEVDPSAKSSLAAIRIVPTEVIQVVSELLISLLGEYRSGWSADDVESRHIAAETVMRKLPPVGWLTRALSDDGPFITSDALLREWPFN